jgi:hypothetical protein
MSCTSPCLDCEYRHQNCHSKCTAYIDFVESYKAAKAEIARIKAGEQSYRAYQSNLTNSICKRTNYRCAAKQIGQR